MVGFSNNKPKKGKKENPPSSKKKVRTNSSKSEPSKKFNVNESEVTTLKKKTEKDVSITNLEKMNEKVEIPNYIPKVEDCDENLFIHIINHSKVKKFEPFIIGKVDNSVLENIDRHIRESKEELNPLDSVDLSDGDRLKTLTR